MFDIIKKKTKKIKRMYTDMINNFVPLPVIASFSADGKILPLYVQLFPERKPVKIDVKTTTTAITYISYDCIYTIDEDELIHRVELIWLKDRQLWGYVK